MWNHGWLTRAYSRFLYVTRLKVLGRTPSKPIQPNQVSYMLMRVFTTSTLFGVLSPWLELALTKLTGFRSQSSKGQNDAMHQQTRQQRMELITLARARYDRRWKNLGSLSESSLWRRWEIEAALNLRSRTARSDMSFLLPPLPCIRCQTAVVRPHTTLSAAGMPFPLASTF